MELATKGNVWKRGSTLIQFVVVGRLVTSNFSLFYFISVTSMGNIYVEKRKNMLLAWDGLHSEDIIML